MRRHRTPVVTSRGVELNVRDQAEGVEPFYPRALVGGEGAEQALRFALALMAVRCVSTHEVEQVTETLCGAEGRASQVSRPATPFAEKLETEACERVAHAPGEDHLAVVGPLGGRQVPGGVRPV